MAAINLPEGYLSAFIYDNHAPCSRTLAGICVHSTALRWTVSDLALIRVNDPSAFLDKMWYDLRMNDCAICNTEDRIKRTSLQIQVVCPTCGAVTDRRIHIADYDGIASEVAQTAGHMVGHMPMPPILRIYGPSGLRSKVILDQVASECQYVATMRHEGNQTNGTDRQAGASYPDPRAGKFPQWGPGYVAPNNAYAVPYPAHTPRGGPSLSPRLDLPTEQSDEPIRAYRAAVLDRLDGKLVLRSVVTAQHKTVPPEGYAYCAKDDAWQRFSGGPPPWSHEAPDDGCSCGWYGTPSYATNPYPIDVISGNRVGLEVEFFGKIVKHELGWRAQYQRILAVDVPLKQHCQLWPEPYDQCPLPPTGLNPNSFMQYCKHHQNGEKPLTLVDMANDLQVDVRWYDGKS